MLFLQFIQKDCPDKHLWCIFKLLFVANVCGKCLILANFMCGYFDQIYTKEEISQHFVYIYRFHDKCALGF